MIRVVVCTVFSLLIACGGGSSGGSSEGGGSNSESFRIEHLSAGDATVQSTGLSAFSQPSSNLSGVQDQLSFNRGDHFFEKKFGVGDGLGPLFNNTSCQGCHVNDGRGHASREAAPDNGLDFDSLLIKTFKSQLTETQKDEMKMGRLSSVGDSQVGVQLQNKSIEGVPAESELRVSYEPVFVTFKDGERVTLRKPIWHVNYLGDGMLDDDTVFSIRVAPPMIGLGMLEAINERDIRSREDPNDLNNDGISGRSNVVINQETNALELGRFGWKAGLPTLRAQTAVAFNHDMGLTTFIIPKGDCLPHQVACNAEKQVVKESEFEVSLSSFDDVVFYSRNLAVPARRNAYDQSIQAGKALFNKVGCGSCHVAQYKTIRTSHFAQSEQVIFPYTDLLLHDMGADLADVKLDGKPASKNVLSEFSATAHEWRTPPLWGLGLAKTIDPKASFLHDGRARTIMEAILWHGGEAKASQEKVLGLSRSERESLLAFLNDL